MSVQTAMIIDDDPDFGLLMTAALSERKIYAMAVQSLPEAQGYLGYMKPTFVFLDNSFPEGMGINFIRNIKSADDDIKIIMMTADASPWIEEKAYEEGANYFIRKPFSKTVIDMLLDEINFKKSEGINNQLSS